MTAGGLSCPVISRAPSVSCATRLKLSICLLVECPALAVRLDLSFRSVYFFYPGISSEPLNLSQQKFAR